jgi:ABC-type spermidine/putrescine transport system permease subunit I
LNQASAWPAQARVSSTIGTTWQVIVNLAQGNGALIDAVKPVEGATGWSDTWMLSSQAANPNCMKLWMDWIASPWANSQVAVWFGEAPSNADSCTLDGMAEHCATFHAEEDDYWSDVWYWTTATEECLDGRTDVSCVPYTEWVNAWTKLRSYGATPAGGWASGPFRPSRALNRFFHGRRRLGVGSLLGLPLSWMLVIYIGSLAMLVGSAMYALDPSSQKPSHNLTWHNLSMSFNLADPDVRETVLWPFLRTARMAVLVTLICAAVAVPVAFFVAKVAWRWSRRAIIVSMLLPLWAGYLVKGYAWRAMVSPAGGKFAAAGRGDGGFFASTLGWTPGLGQMAILLAEVYLWLPYMILPVYAGIDRLPPSLLDAAGDLGARTFRSVILR